MHKCIFFLALLQNKYYWALLNWSEQHSNSTKPIQTGRFCTFCMWEKQEFFLHFEWTSPLMVQSVASLFKDSGVGLDWVPYNRGCDIICFNTIFKSHNMQQWDFLFLLWEEGAPRCRPVGNVFIYYVQACWCAELYPTKLIILEWPFCIGATALQFMNV